jgi:hypothetical protein
VLNDSILIWPVPGPELRQTKISLTGEDARHSTENWKWVGRQTWEEFKTVARGSLAKENFKIVADLCKSLKIFLSPS